MPVSSAGARRRSSADGLMLPRSLRWWVLVCLISLLGFQALGMVHRTLHGRAVQARLLLAAIAEADAVEAAEEADEANEASDVAAAVTASAQPDTADTAPEVPSLGHVAGGTDCQLLDQASQVLGPIVQALAWTALLPDHPVATPQPHSATVAVVWRAPARAPPAA